MGSTIFHSKGNGTQVSAMMYTSGLARHLSEGILVGKSGAYVYNHPLDDAKLINLFK